MTLLSVENDICLQKHFLSTLLKQILACVIIVVVFIEDEDIALLLESSLLRMTWVIALSKQCLYFRKKNTSLKKNMWFI